MSRKSTSFAHRTASLSQRPFDSPLVLTFAAVLSTVGSNATFKRQSETYSEILAWILLPVFFLYSKRKNFDPKPPFSDVDIRSASSWSLWLIAIGVTIMSGYKSEVGMLRSMPLLTPLSLLADRYIASDVPAPSSNQSWSFDPLKPTISGSFLVALAVTYILYGNDILKFALSVGVGIIWLVVYVSLLSNHHRHLQVLPHLCDVEESISLLARRVVVLLCVWLFTETAIFGLIRTNLWSTLSLGLAKALSWYFTIRLIRHAPWYVAAVVENFGLLSTLDPFQQTEDLQAILHVIASLVTLGQINHFLPSSSKNRAMIWLLAIVPLTPYFLNMHAINSAQSRAQSSFAAVDKHHPVQSLVDSARNDFTNLLRRQSRSYIAAKTEYKRRYGIEAPPGFEKWYEFAVSHQSPVIDDFDTILRSISPLLKLSGKQIIEANKQARNAAGSDVWLCTLDANNPQIQCNHTWRSYDRHISFSFDKLLNGVRNQIPPVQFVVNHLDEPRVLIPPSPQGTEERDHNGFVNLTNLSHQPNWEVLTKHCRMQSDFHDYSILNGAETYVLPFVTNSSEAIDLCRHPEYNNINGFFMSPTSLRLIEGLVPVLSTGTLSTMGDILYPSPAYLEDEFIYTDTPDFEWSQKKNNLYWAGSTSGSFAIDDHWHQHHRQRFVAVAQNLGRQHHRYLRESGDTISVIKSTFLNSRLFNVAFTRIFQCQRQQCHAQRTYFNTKGWADKDEAFRSRLVFDLDGNGISGRYYKLLASKSCPLKQTLFREWHDDRLVPWVHYVPVSQCLEELPELVTYLTQNAKGQEIAKLVADQGREWFQGAFRDVDMTIYVYRLLLELARLSDPEREPLL